MAKILLVQVNYDIDNPCPDSPTMPLALIELATLIDGENHEVKIFDRNIYYDDKKLIRLLQIFNPDAVGMTCYTSSGIKDLQRVSKVVKENSCALVLIGGIHATLEPKSLLDSPDIDYVIRGEGKDHYWTYVD